METSRDLINWPLITAKADELFGRKSKGCRVLFFRSNDDPIRPIFNRARFIAHSGIPDFP